MVTPDTVNAAADTPPQLGVLLNEIPPTLLVFPVMVAVPLKNCGAQPAVDATIFTKLTPALKFACGILIEVAEATPGKVVAPNTG